MAPHATTVARITNMAQVRTLERALGIDFSPADEKRLIGGAIVRYDHETSLHIRTKANGNGEWNELDVDPKLGGTKAFMPNGSQESSGDLAIFHVPSDYREESVRTARRFIATFGQCTSAFSTSMDNVRRSFRLPTCIQPEPGK